MAGESIAAPRNGFDERCLRGVVAKRPAEHRNGMNQAVIGNGDVVPDGADDLFSVHRPVAVSDEIAQRLERT